MSHRRRKRFICDEEDFWSDNDTLQSSSETETEEVHPVRKGPLQLSSDKSWREKLKLGKKPVKKATTCSPSQESLPTQGSPSSTTVTANKVPSARHTSPSTTRSISPSTLSSVASENRDVSSYSEESLSTKSIPKACKSRITARVKQPTQGNKGLENSLRTIGLSKENITDKYATTSDKQFAAVVTKSFRGDANNRSTKSNATNSFLQKAKRQHELTKKQGKANKQVTITQMFDGMEQLPTKSDHAESEPICLDSDNEQLTSFRKRDRILEQTEVKMPKKTSISHGKVMHGSVVKQVRVAGDSRCWDSADSHHSTRTVRESPELMHRMESSRQDVSFGDINQVGTLGRKVDAFVQPSKSRNLKSAPATFKTASIVNSGTRRCLSFETFNSSPREELHHALTERVGITQHGKQVRFSHSPQPPVNAQQLEHRQRSTDRHENNSGKPTEIEEDGVVNGCKGSKVAAPGPQVSLVEQPNFSLGLAFTQSPTMNNTSSLSISPKDSTHRKKCETLSRPALPLLHEGSSSSDKRSGNAVVAVKQTNSTTSQSNSKWTCHRCTSPNTFETIKCERCSWSRESGLSLAPVSGELQNATLESRSDIRISGSTANRDPLREPAGSLNEGDFIRQSGQASVLTKDSSTSDHEPRFPTQSMPIDISFQTEMPETWECSECTQDNDFKAATCSYCNQPGPVTSMKHNRSNGGTPRIIPETPPSSPEVEMMSSPSLSSARSATKVTAERKKISSRESCTTFSAQNNGQHVTTHSSREDALPKNHRSRLSLGLDPSDLLDTDEPERQHRGSFFLGLDSLGTKVAIVPEQQHRISNSPLGLSSGATVPDKQNQQHSGANFSLGLDSLGTKDTDGQEQQHSGAKFSLGLNSRGATDPDEQKQQHGSSNFSLGIDSLGAKDTVEQDQQHSSSNFSLGSSSGTKDTGGQEQQHSSSNFSLGMDSLSTKDTVEQEQQHNSSNFSLGLNSRGATVTGGPEQQHSSSNFSLGMDSLGAKDTVEQEQQHSSSNFSLGLSSGTKDTGGQEQQHSSSNFSLGMDSLGTKDTGGQEQQHSSSNFSLGMDSLGAKDTVEQEQQQSSSNFSLGLSLDAKTTDGLVQRQQPNGSNFPLRLNSLGTRDTDGPEQQQHNGSNFSLQLNSVETANAKSLAPNGIPAWVCQRCTARNSKMNAKCEHCSWVKQDVQYSNESSRLPTEIGFASNSPRTSALLSNDRHNAGNSLSPQQTVDMNAIIREGRDGGVDNNACHALGQDHLRKPNVTVEARRSVDKFSDEDDIPALSMRSRRRIRQILDSPEPVQSRHNSSKSVVLERSGNLVQQMPSDQGSLALGLGQGEDDQVIDLALSQEKKRRRKAARLVFSSDSEEDECPLPRRLRQVASQQQQLVHITSASDTESDVEDERGDVQSISSDQVFCINDESDSSDLEDLCCGGCGQPVSAGATSRALSVPSPITLRCCRCLEAFHAHCSGELEQAWASAGRASDLNRWKCRDCQQSATHGSVIEIEVEAPQPALGEIPLLRHFRSISQLRSSNEPVGIDYLSQFNDGGSGGVNRSRVTQRAKKLLAERTPQKKAYRKKRGRKRKQSSRATSKKTTKSRTTRKSKGKTASSSTGISSSNLTSLSGIQSMSLPVPATQGRAASIQPRLGRLGI